MAKYPCPCCGYFVFDEKPGSYEICEICGWEDDLSQLRFPTTSGANEPLIECQERFATETEKVGIRHERDFGWRRLDLRTDQVEMPEPGRDNGQTYAVDQTAYYYWRG